MSVLCMRASFHSKFLLKGEFKLLALRDVILMDMMGSNRVGFPGGEKDISFKSCTQKGAII